MKKALSLALTASMLASMLSFNVSANNFTDHADVDYTQAVDVISAVKVIDGYVDGSFNPTATLTRGAAAKIICNMMLSPTTAGALTADTAPFPDVTADHTFAGYIAYCAQQGIISGYEDGLFRPAGEVTAYQFMKMLLGALGYNSNVEGFTGSNWSVNVAKLALALGLDDGNEDFTGSKAMTREEACLYAFNTLTATMVEYESLGSDIVVGDIIINTGASKPTEKKNTSATDGNITDDGLMQFAESNFRDLSKTATAADSFGRPASEWKVKSTAIGTYVDNTQLQGNYAGKVSMGTLYTLLGKTLVNDLTKGDATLTVYEDGFQTEVEASDIGNYIKANSSASISTNGADVNVYVDDDKNVTIVIANTYVFQATGDYSDKSETVKVTSAGDTAISLASTTLSADDFDIADVVEDDYLLMQVTRAGTSGGYTVESVTPAKMLTGKVTSYTQKTSVTIDGEKFNYSGTTSDTGVQNTAYSVGEDTRVVLDTKGNIIAVDQVVTSSENYVFIRETASVGSFNGTVNAAAFFVDGTYAEITLKKVADSTADADLLAADGWYTFSEDSNGKFTLTALDSDEVTGSADFETAGTVVSNGKVNFLTGETVKANSETVFVTVDADDEMGLYNGVTNVPTITASGNDGTKVQVRWVADKTSNFASFVFVDMSLDNKSSVDNNDAANSDFAYILDLKQTSVDKNGDKFYTYNAIVDGEETTISADSTGVFTGGKLYNNLKVNANGYVTSAKEITDGAEYAVGDIADTLGYHDGTLEIGEDFFILSDDATIVLVSSAAELNRDSGADYEITMDMSGKALHTLAGEYSSITGTYSAVMTEKDSQLVDVIYIAISDVAE